MIKENGIIRGEILEINLTDGYLKVRDSDGKKHTIKAMVSQLIRTMPGRRIEVDVLEGHAVSIKPLVKETDGSKILEEEKQDA